MRKALRLNISKQKTDPEESRTAVKTEKKRNRPADQEFKEILNLHKMLLSEDIPHLFRECYDGYTIRYPNVGKTICFATQRRLNKGYGSGKIDICGLQTDEEKAGDTGTRMAMVYNLTGKDILKRIRDHYDAHGGSA